MCEVNLSESSQMARFLKRSSHLTNIVSCALQPQDDRIQCTMDRNVEFFLTSTLIFYSFLDNLEIKLQIKYVSGNKK